MSMYNTPRYAVWFNSETKLFEVWDTYATTKALETFAERLAARACCDLLNESAGHATVRSY